MSRPPEGRRFQKGMSGNPKGRSKVWPEFREACRRGATDALPAMVEAAKAGDATAYKLLAEYGYGKPVQAPAEPGSGENVLTVLVRKFSDRGEK